jgi:hypothetical protein
MTAAHKQVRTFASRLTLPFFARLLVAVAVVVGLFVPSIVSSAAAAETTIFGSAQPRVLSDPDRVAVELGVKFSSSTSGSVTGLRYYKSAANTGPHTGTLWNSRGQALATVTFSKESTSGWQVARFGKPVPITAGKTYVASYHAPHGRYSADENYFTGPKSSGSLTVPASGGVYAYGKTRFPTQTYRDSNYYIDVLFVSGAAPAGGQGSGSTSSPIPTPNPTTSPTPPATPTPTPTPPATDPPVAGAALDLPRIPWEGGSSYWGKFAKPAAAGWTDPSFFPIVVWYNGISSNAEAQYDKSVGINTYIGMDSSTPYSLFKDNDVFWIGDKLNSSFTDASTNWVGRFLDDEVDGRYTPAAGEAYLQSLVNAAPKDGRFNYANFTQMVVSEDMSQKDAQKFVNNYTDAVSLDMYWYTIPYCSQQPYRDVYLTPVSQANCRTSSSYGKMVKSLRQQDATDGKLQPVWSFVENLNGGPGKEAPAVTITPGQLQGAVMDSVINEARGIIYFNQSLSGSCQGGSIFRQSQVTANFCGAAQVAGAKTVDGKIHDLASVINTQSYQYTFGTGLDTMLKTQGDSAYIFAMVDGSSKPGSRTFQLPAGVKGRSVEALYENRTIPVDASGKFTDTFANEYSYHIYKVSLG